jgi:Putative enzyme of poly-gamma-glutamate biosynthesis (capsule formation)
MKKAFILILVLAISVIGFGYIKGINGKGLGFIPTLIAFTNNDIVPTYKATEGSTPKPTLEPTATPEPTVQPLLKLVAVGDIMMGRAVGKRLGNNPEGYYAAFKDVAATLKQGDIVFANLESPLTSSTNSLSKKNKIILKASPDCIDALKNAGFNVLSLANNHMMDYYDKGLFDTMKLLNENKIAYTGAGKNLDEARKPVIIEKNGLRFGIISYTDMAYTYVGNPSINYAASDNRAGVVPRKYELIHEDIVKLRGKVDLIAVSLHWGVEETFKITPEMTEFAHRLLDDGADMILGHHPHQFQGIEVYKGKPIIYSMGNFIFDQNDPENMETFIMEMDYEKNVLKSLSAIPVKIVDKSRAEIQKPSDAADLIGREMNLCNQLGTSCSMKEDKLVFNLN